jgi:hypothetical protein
VQTSGAKRSNRSREQDDFFFTWVIRYEADHGPPAGRHRDGVPLLRVDEVELLLRGRVVVAEPLRDDEEIEPVQVHRVALAPHQRRVLQHHLHRRVVRQRPHLRGLRSREQQRRGDAAQQQPLRLVRVVERHGRLVGEVPRVHAVRRVPVPRVQHRHGVCVWELERLVVHARDDRARSLVLVAGDEAQPDRDEHAGVDGERHGPPAWADERRHAGVEPVGRGRVVHLRHLGQRRRLLAARRRRSDVLHDGRGDVSVVAPWAQWGRALVRGDRHVVAARARGRVGHHERVDGLSRRDDDHVRLVLRGVAGVRRHDGERVPCHLEEERRVERSVDNPQHVGGVMTHLELLDSCMRGSNVRTYSQ